MSAFSRLMVFCSAVVLAGIGAGPARVTGTTLSRSNINFIVADDIGILGLSRFLRVTSAHVVV